MAEFGELLPGTEWRAMNGTRKVVLSCLTVVKIDTAGVPTTYRTDHETDCSLVESWVPWVEPIAVGDRVIYEETAGCASPRTVLATFTTMGGREFAVLSSYNNEGFSFALASECRKVNDE